MLVLSRKESEKIKIGDSVVITVVKVAGDRVRIGIEAPNDVVVLREELRPFNDSPEAAPSVGSAPVAGVPAAALSPGLPAAIPGLGRSLMSRRRGYSRSA